MGQRLSFNGLDGTVWCQFAGPTDDDLKIVIRPWPAPCSGRDRGEACRPVHGSMKRPLFCLSETEAPGIFGWLAHRHSSVPAIFSLGPKTDMALGRRRRPQH
jgi:hypothetical protein